MSEIALEVRNLSKLYRLGEVGTGTLSHDLNRWWARVRGQEDPTSIIGQVNRRDQKAEGDYVWALKDVNFDVEEGEILGIIGANGAGKSTLLKLISRITSPTTGHIRANGRIASLLEVGTGMHPEMTARENVYLNGAILGMRRHEITRQFDDIIDFAGCQMYVDTPVKRFSSGMRVRLGFAVAAFLQAEILIVDEVLAVGDAEFQERCNGKMREVRTSGRTILFASHNMSAIAAICKHAIHIRTGNIVFYGSAQDAISQYADVPAGASIVKRVPTGPLGLVRCELILLYPDSFQLNLEIDSSVTDEIAVDTRLSDLAGIPIAYGSLGAFHPSNMLLVKPGKNMISIRHEVPGLAFGEYKISVDLTYPGVKYLERHEDLLHLQWPPYPVFPDESPVYLEWKKGHWKLPADLISQTHEEGV